MPSRRGPARDHSGYGLEPRQRLQGARRMEFDIQSDTLTVLGCPPRPTPSVAQGIKGRMDQDIIKHDNAIFSWITLRVGRKGVTTRILTIETDLSLNPDDPNYQKDAVDSLMAAAVTYIRERRHIDSFEIVQIRQGSLEVTSIGN